MIDHELTTITPHTLINNKLLFLEEGKEFQYEIIKQEPSMFSELTVYHFEFDNQVFVRSFFNEDRVSPTEFEIISHELKPVL